MAAAEMTETLVKQSFPGLQLKDAIYTVSITTQNDWVIFDDFKKVLGVYAEVAASGVKNACTIDGSTLNKVVFTSATTGAMRVRVWGY